MIILTLKIKVKDRPTMREILETGKAYSLLDCEILDWKEEELK